MPGPERGKFYSPIRGVAGKVAGKIEVGRKNDAVEKSAPVLLTGLGELWMRGWIEAAAGEADPL